MEDERKKYKIIFLGDQSVGKSSILNRYVKSLFEDTYQATVGLDFVSKNVEIGGKSLRMLLYDTAGQEKFKALIPMYLRDANVIIVVYDITNPTSFMHVSNWIHESIDLKRKDAFFVIVGNKIDLVSQREVSEQEGKDYCTKSGYIFCEVSAKSGENIEKLFTDFVFPEMKKRFLDNENSNDNNAEAQNNNEVVPGQNLQAPNNAGSGPKKKKKCC